MFVNPFDLLGASPNSTCQEVRKRYYALACLCHPDRGGTSEQMQTLHNAYQYVMHQVALNRTATFEDLEADFADFCESQTSKPPPFVDIHAEAFNLPRFNDLFDLHSTDEIDRAFEEGGYETVPSDIGLEYNPVVETTIDAFTTDIIEYKEPQALVMPHECVRDLTGTRPDNFSCVVGSVTASDYRAALSPPAPIQCDVPVGDVMANFRQMAAERGIEVK